MTIFDKILAGSVPCKKVYDDDMVLAFHDIHPQAPVHVLVIPKKKIANLNALSLEDAAYIGQFMQKVVHVAAELGVQNNGYRLVFNVGQDGGQTVNYLHAHILGGKTLGGFE